MWAILYDHQEVIADLYCGGIFATQSQNLPPGFFTILVPKRVVFRPRLIVCNKNPV